MDIRCLLHILVYNLVESLGIPFGMNIQLVDLHFYIGCWDHMAMDYMVHTL